MKAKEIQLMGRVMGDDICMVLEDHDIELVFGDDIVDQNELVEMELDGVMELV